MTTRLRVISYKEHLLLQKHPFDKASTISFNAYLDNLRIENNFPRTTEEINLDNSWINGQLQYEEYITKKDLINK
jgi:hypothetical protein